MGFVSLIHHNAPNNNRFQVSKFGSSCNLPDAFVTKVLKSGVVSVHFVSSTMKKNNDTKVEVIAQWAQFKEKKVSPLQTRT
jgi:hypothetical protein